MAKTCVQCGKKMGFLQNPIDGAYCSLDCQAAHQRQIVETEQRAAVKRAEAQRQAEQEAQEARERYAAEQAAAKLLRTCPKCDAEWAYTAGGGADGADAGSCQSCGFSAQFAKITKCPTCEGETLLVAVDGSSRCPRCKSRF